MRATEHMYDLALRNSKKNCMWYWLYCGDCYSL